MKAFSFRLEKALRWRETQVDLQKARVSAALAQVSRAQAMLDACRADAENGAAELMREPSSAALASYAAFTGRARARIRQAEELIAAAKRALAAEREKLVEASRKAHLIGNLEASQRAQWRREFDRELATFADESFLIGLQSKKRTGA